MQRAEGGNGHVNDLEIAAYIDRGLSPADRERVEAHFAECDECRSAIVEGSAHVARQRRRRTLTLAVLTSAAAASVLFLVIPTGRRSPGDATVRGAAGPAAGGSAAVIAYGPIGQVGSGPLRFTWGATPSALSYRLTLSSVVGPMFSASTGDTSFALPDSVRLQTGARYLWSVDALLANGDTRTTGIREFILGP
jgi:anti-sigma factor RsiW